MKKIIAIVLLTISMHSQAKFGDAADAPTPPITINIVKPTPSIYE